MSNEVNISKILDGDIDELRGQEATGQRPWCPICCKTFGCVYRFYDDRHLKFLLELSNECRSNGYQDIADKYLTKYDTIYLHRRAVAEYVPVKRKKHAGHSLGAREFTLTYSHKWFDDTEARRLMLIAVERLLKYYAGEITEFQVVGETGEKGQSHIHGFYLLKGGKKITDKNFQRAWSHWNPKKKLGAGHEGGHHGEVRSVADFKGYIDKEKNPWYKYIHNAGISS